MKKLIVFLFLAAFGAAGVIRYSKAAVPGPEPSVLAREAPRALAAVGAASSLAQAGAPQLQPSAQPQVLRQKRRFAKAALRALKKAQIQEQAKPLRVVAKLAKPKRR